MQSDVPAQRRGLAEGARSQRLLQALVKLFYAQPTVTRGYPQQLRDPVPIRMRRAQLAERDRITTAPRHRHLTPSWDTLQGMTLIWTTPMPGRSQRMRRARIRPGPKRMMSARSPA